jgi:hypothetical protein
VKKLLSILGWGLTGVCIVLWTASLGAWGWGHFAFISIQRNASPLEAGIGVSRGEFFVSVLHENESDARPDSPVEWSASVQEPSDLTVSWAPLFPRAHKPVAGFFAGTTVLAGEEQTLVLAPMPAVVGVLA